MRLFNLPVVFAASISLLGAAAAKECPRAKNFIYVVPDGYGSASQTLARDYYSLTEGDATVSRPNTAHIGADSMLIGSVRTYAWDNLITDSAASGTAFACGYKSYNGAIAVTPDGEPVGSILEAAFLDGMKTGLVVTSRITHATPAVYSAHVLDRDSENEIAGHQVGYSHPFGPFVDIIIGGGRRHYLPTEEGGKRTDGVNLIDWATEHGYTYAHDASSMEESLVDGLLPLPYLGLLQSSHIDYEIDRDPEQTPSLLQNVVRSIETLSKAVENEEKGFFIMIEASRIDHAGHANDIAPHVHETLMFNEVMAYLKDFVAENPDTQILSAADHECGGLTLHDNYDPTIILRSQGSTEALAPKFDEESGDDKAAYLAELLPEFGVVDFSDEDVANWIDIYESSGSTAMATDIALSFAASAGISWTSGGHSAVDVQLHGFAANPKHLAYLKKELSTQNNNDILPKYIAKILGLNLDDATEALRKNGSDWVERRDMLETIKRDAASSKHHAHHS